MRERASACWYGNCAYRRMLHHLRRAAQPNRSRTTRLTSLLAGRYGPRGSVSCTNEAAPEGVSHPLLRGEGVRGRARPRWNGLIVYKRVSFQSRRVAELTWVERCQSGCPARGDGCVLKGRGAGQATQGTRACRESHGVFRAGSERLKCSPAPGLSSSPLIAISCRSKSKSVRPERS